MKKVFSVLLALALVMGLTIGTVGAVTPAPNWDISGTWSVAFTGNSTYREFVDLVQDEFGHVTGEYWWMNGTIWEYGGTLVGDVSGNDLYLYYTRDLNPTPYEGEWVGTITKTGMSGYFQGLVGTTYYNTWTTIGNPTLLYEARITGGGQLRNESSVFDKKGRDINYKISFGLGLFIVNGEYWLDGADVTFHNVSVPGVVGGKFVGERITAMNFYEDGSIANCYMFGAFNGVSGYQLIVRAQDGGEPGTDDNLRFELKLGGVKVYDTYPSDFPGESSDTGTARHFLEKGNIQVEDLR